MAAPIRPASAKAYGREKWFFAPAVADLTEPTVAEVTAVTGLDISCYMFDSSGDPTQNTNLVERQRRRCDTKTFQQIGTTQYDGGELRYAVDPQAVAASDGKKAWEKFPEGTTGFFIRRFNVDVDTDLAAGQFVDVFPVELGPPMTTKEGDGESSEVAATQTFAITSDPEFIVAIVA